MPTKITVKNNGSLRVESPDIELYDQDGNRFDINGATLLKFCRCGQSADMPFCDSTHKTIGFSAACTARAWQPKQKT
jgi:CDGSH-type Zn-finger protein